MDASPCRNAPHTALAHLGCAFFMLLLALCGSLGLLSTDFHLWLMTHPYTMPIGFLVAVVAAYLLENSLSTAAMLTLLAISAACGGFSLCGINPEACHKLNWILVSGPLGYFLTAAIFLHLQQESLYRWQLCSIFIAGAVLLPLLTGLILGEHFPIIFMGCNTGILIAVYELYILFSRSYHEITSESRIRSTVIAMVMFITVPICKSIWYSLYYGRGLLSAIFRIFHRL